MPLSWGRHYCVYKYQGFLFLYFDSGFIQCSRLSDRTFSISSAFLSIPSVPIMSNHLAGPRVAPEKRSSVINA